MLTPRPYRRLRSQDSENSLPPVSPDGRRISTSAMIAPSRTSREPSGSVSRNADVHRVLRVAEERVGAADEERADHGAPEAADASDHEHRERDEGELEVDLVGGDAPELVHEQAAGEAARAPLSVNATRRWRWTSIPLACAAGGSSRVARSWRPNRLRW